MAAFTVLGWVTIPWSRVDMPGMLVFGLTLFTLVAVIAIRAYWSGENWARKFVLALSLLTIQIADWGKSTLALTIYRVAQVGLAIFLLFWLNGKEARAHFGALYQERTPAQNVS